MHVPERIEVRPPPTAGDQGARGTGVPGTRRRELPLALVPPAPIFGEQAVGTVEVELHLSCVGTLAILRTPVDIFPGIKLPVLSVVWTYNGLPPSEMSLGSAT